MIVPSSLSLSVVAYYLRSLALARQEMIVLLRGQLMLEGQDKVMLLQLIDDADTRECSSHCVVLYSIEQLKHSGGAGGMQDSHWRCCNIGGCNYVVYTVCVVQRSFTRLCYRLSVSLCAILYHLSRFVVARICEHYIIK